MARSTASYPRAARDRSFFSHGSLEPIRLTSRDLKQPTLSSENQRVSPRFSLAESGLTPLGAYGNLTHQVAEFRATKTELFYVPHCFNYECRRRDSAKSRSCGFPPTKIPSGE
jgi:hypothetical protein